MDDSTTQTTHSTAGGRTGVEEALDDLVANVHRAVIEACVKVSKISRVSKTENEYQSGYNQACDDIAVRIAALAETGGAA